MRSASEVRSAMARMASTRPTPICISWSSRANSWTSGPSVLLGDAAHGRVEAQTRLDRDGEQVHRVGKALRIRVSRLVPAL